MLHGLAIAIVIVCTTALVARTLPHLIFDPALVEESRLGVPLTYWNALGLLAGWNSKFCGHLACSVRYSRPSRVFGAASIPLLTSTCHDTLSRGATWATVAAVVVYVLVGRPRALILGVLATMPPTFAILLIANPSNVDREGNPAGLISVAARSAHRYRPGDLHRWCGPPTGILVLSLDRLMQDFGSPLAPGGRCSAAVAAATLALAASTALNLPAAVGAKYDQFTSRSDSSPSADGARLFKRKYERAQQTLGCRDRSVR